MEPRHFKALFNRGFSYDKLGECEKAIQVRRLTLTLTLTPTLTLQDYTRAIAIEPTNAFAYYNRGISHDRKGMYHEACPT